MDAVQSQLANVYAEISNLKSEFVQVKQDMVTKVQHEDLESRVYTLEQNQIVGQSVTVKYLQDQVDQLDPARRGIATSQCKTDDPPFGQNSSYNDLRPR